MEIIIIKPGRESPLKDHGPMEIGVDGTKPIFYVPELMAVIYGMDSIIKARKSHPNCNTKAIGRA